MFGKQPLRTRSAVEVGQKRKGPSRKKPEGAPACLQGTGAGIHRKKFWARSDGETTASKAFRKRLDAPLPSISSGLFLAQKVSPGYPSPGGLERRQADRLDSVLGKSPKKLKKGNHWHYLHAAKAEEAEKKQMRCPQGVIREWEPQRGNSKSITIRTEKQGASFLLKGGKNTQVCNTTKEVDRGIRGNSQITGSKDALVARNGRMNKYRIRGFWSHRWEKTVKIKETGEI